MLVSSLSAGETKIVFDVGINLYENDNIKIPEIDDSFCCRKKYDAVFVSHYHSDHIGLLDYILNDIPIYIGEKSL